MVRLHLVRDLRAHTRNERRDDNNRTNTFNFWFNFELKFMFRGRICLSACIHQKKKKKNICVLALFCK